MSEDSSERTFRSLADALRAFQIPDENHALIKRFCEYIGIERYENCGTHIKAVRVADGPTLNIAYGWTNGFRSEDEVRQAVGDYAEHWPSGRAKKSGLWGVSHPINRIGHGGGGAQGRGLTDFGTCEIHFLKLPASGICDECE